MAQQQEVVTPICYVIGCEEHSDRYFFFNDDVGTVMAYVCNEHWEKIDNGEEVELVDDTTGHQYKLKFSPPDDILDESSHAS